MNYRGHTFSSNTSRTQEKYKAELIENNMIKIEMRVPALIQEALGVFSEKKEITNNSLILNISEYFTFKEKVKEIRVEGPPNSLLRKMQELDEKKRSVENNVVEILVDRTKTKQDKTLMDFQVDGVKAAVERNYRILIADDMGLGKTIQAIAVVQTYLKENPSEDASLMILSSTTNCKMWEDHAEKYIAIDPSYVIGIKEYIEKKRKRSIVIDTFQKAADRAMCIDPNDFYMAIVDESQSLKNEGSKRTKNLTPLLQKIERTILLSGTPALSKPSELFTQISIISPGMYTHHEYHERYCRIDDVQLQRASRNIQKFIKYSGNRNLEELRRVMEKYIIIRRVKEEHLSLKKKHRIAVLFNTPLATKVSPIKITGSPIQPSEILQEYHAAANEKIEDIISFTKNLRSTSTKKILIFAVHKEMIKRLSEEFKGRCIKIDGDTPKQERKTLCDLFKESSTIDVAILSIQTCSTGITLVCASIVIFAEMAWTPGDNIQAEDRIYRIGQEEEVKIFYLLASYIDKKIWPLIHRKKNVLGAIGITEKNSLDYTHMEYDPRQQFL
ncbi:SWI/SNF-related matrix-associated actin-dependent regulator of chromatin subfamily A-like protein 1 [Nematocida sp. LUAm3]|nr:SWI/SNF-related matrix-associated actin-dependent regulator of chromatin subfamily A-like protein 1 [Nematocida sp. LUAm3]KAI5175692.1 SWI/SNF-related matrix-associated actin-dependent regulator of chromatin subfamily A-like protein 1 [Nematocida sp. LUAm2]KAI5178598.1 SWI/SNF-related matrix-associated actin-dependent regulator of chromatin subfamily A-like protein 1 [Nematocida sp. LUAm1]